MLTRIVRLEFQKDKTEDFEEIFNSSKELIRGFEGCEYLSLHKDHSNTSVYFTLSKWTNETALNTYRGSKLFKETWAKTKVLFCEKPKAYSLDQLVELI